KQVRTVFAHPYATARIARNVPSDSGEFGDSLLSVFLSDGHQVVSTSARLEQRCAIIGCTRAGKVHRQLEQGCSHVRGLRLEMLARIRCVLELGQRTQHRRAQSRGEGPRAIRCAALIESVCASNQLLNSNDQGRGCHDHTFVLCRTPRRERNGSLGTLRTVTALPCRAAT